jgi:hypothetical protein
MTATQLKAMRDLATARGPYQIIGAHGQVIAFGLSYAKAQEWAQVYGGASVSRGDVATFQRWQKGAR